MLHFSGKLLNCKKTAAVFLILLNFFRFIAYVSACWSPLLLNVSPPLSVNKIYSIRESQFHQEHSKVCILNTALTRVKLIQYVKLFSVSLYLLKIMGSAILFMAFCFSFLSMTKKGSRLSKPTNDKEDNSASTLLVSLFFILVGKKSVVKKKNSYIFEEHSLTLKK